MNYVIKLPFNLLYDNDIEKSRGYVFHDFNFCLNYGLNNIKSPFVIYNINKNKDVFRKAYF